MDDIRPIPKKLLPHTVSLYKKVEKDRWGKGTWNEGTIIEFVRIEPSTKIVRDKNNAEIQLSATIFYDCKNSCPREIDFAVDDIVIFNGEKHQVKVIEPLFDEKKLHHYELGLVKYA